MKALILGIDTVIGKALAEELLYKGYEVSGCSKQQVKLPANVKFFKLDLSKPNEVLFLFDRISPHAVFHLDFSYDEEDDLVKKNVENTKNVIDASEEIDRTSLVVLSSYLVYGRPKLVPIPEDHPLAPNTEVGKSFALAENLAKDSAKKGFRVLITRTFGYIPGNAKEHQKIDLINVKDLAKALIIAAEKGDPGDPYNVCSGNTYEFESKKGAILIKTDTTSIVGDNRKFFRKTGWRPQESVEAKVK